MTRIAIACVLASCASAPRPFPLRPPFARDPDLTSYELPCRPDPTPKEPKRTTCAPVQYVSPFIWDQVDNMVFARISRGLHVDVSGEAVNPNSLDEVADSAWFTNRPVDALAHDDNAPGACKPEDMLPPADQVPDGTWVIDHGKDNGASLGFRVDVPGKGLYMLKADDVGVPDQASAGSVIGAALYDAVGFYTTCEQIVVVRKGQLKLAPNLTTKDNLGNKHPFDEKALDAVLAGATQVVPGKLVRFQASKWLPGVTVGPFHYEGTRPDDPADAIPHEDRRELRGSRLIAAWMNHWDAREQNSMDVWMADDAKHKRSSPGHVIHYILDTSDALGALGGTHALGALQGFAYVVDPPDIFRALFTFGFDERPWDRVHVTPGHEKFNYFNADDFVPQDWKPSYANPAFLAMSERDGAWMARLIARFSEADLARIVGHAKFNNPTDAPWLTGVLVARQRKILERYLTKLSPLGEVHAVGTDRICAVDFARLRAIVPAERFHYAVVERAGRHAVTLSASAGADGGVCFATQPIVEGAHPDGDPAQRVTITVENGMHAGPLVIHAYDLGARGMFVAGLDRPAR